MKRIATFLLIFFVVEHKSSSQSVLPEGVFSVDLLEFFKTIEERSDPHWEPEEENLHLQGKLREIWEEDGEKIFMEFFKASGGRGFYYRGINQIHRDSVLHYYHNVLKVEEFDSLTHKIRTKHYEEEWLIEYHHGAKYSTYETYYFHKNGKETGYVEIFWNEDKFKSWYQNRYDKPKESKKIQ